jgi:hypothetical protein
MPTQFGPSGFFSNSSRKENNISPKRGNSPSLISARVKEIILDDSNKELFDKFGGWNSIGVILFETISNPEFATPITEANAYPLFPNIKHYPLKEEVVTLIRASNVSSEGDITSVSWYYLPPINIWGSQVHNALPLTLDPEDESDDYQKAEAGYVRQVSDSNVGINLGQTFNENNVIDIHPLLPYEGDIIYEGRFGNSIRLGSTVNNAKIPNTWSSVGENGSPIFIIRNGQGPLTTESWIPTTEDINNDKSSIYLTSTQQIPLFPASNRTDSYRKSTKPEEVGVYTGEQIILNSGRLVFNAKIDSIILGAEKSIHLTSNTSVNVDAGNQIALVAPKVYLGSTTGDEGTQLQSVVKGENLNTLLGEVSSFLLSLSVYFKTAADSTGAPIASLQQASSKAKTLGQSMQNIVNGKDLLSKQVKTV